MCGRTDVGCKFISHFAVFTKVCCLCRFQLWTIYWRSASFCWWHIL